MVVVMNIGKKPYFPKVPFIEYRTHSALPLIPLFPKNKGIRVDSKRVFPLLRELTKNKGYKQKVLRYPVATRPQCIEAINNQ